MTAPNDPALTKRRAEAEARLQGLLAKFQRAGVAPNAGHVAAQAMGMLISRLVSAGFVQEDEAKAELAENEYRILKPLLARALQQQEEEKLTAGGVSVTGHKKAKRHDAAHSEPATFTSPALLRRERERERERTRTRTGRSTQVTNKG